MADDQPAASPHQHSCSTCETSWERSGHSRRQSAGQPRCRQRRPLAVGLERLITRRPDPDLRRSGGVRVRVHPELLEPSSPRSVTTRCSWWFCRRRVTVTTTTTRRNDDGALELDYAAATRVPAPTATSAGSPAATTAAATATFTNNASATTVSAVGSIPGTGHPGCTHSHRSLTLYCSTTHRNLSTLCSVPAFPSEPHSTTRSSSRPAGSTFAPGHGAAQAVPPLAHYVSQAEQHPIAPGRFQWRAGRGGQNGRLLGRAGRGLHDGHAEWRDFQCELWLSASCFSTFATFGVRCSVLMCHRS